MPILASAGAALVMSECTLHTGLPKTTASIRSNLYFNYVETGSMNPMSRAPYFGNSERSQADGLLLQPLTSGFCAQTSCGLRTFGRGCARRRRS